MVFFVGQIFVLCDDDVYDVRLEIQNGGNDCINLNDCGEGSDFGILDVVFQQFFYDMQMFGVGNRQEFGDVFDYVEDDGVQLVYG